MNYFLRIINISFLTAITLTPSCQGQINAEQHRNVAVDQLSFTSKNKKLIKTQGTTEHQNVHCSLQDKDGNLWFGTTGEGVYRYDGKYFIQFTEKDGLSNNKVLSILEDRSGKIWFGTDDGLACYDGKTISKIPIAINSSNGFGMSIPQTGINPVYSMMQDQYGLIWFGTSQDLYCYDGKSFSRFLDRADVKNDQRLKLKSVQCFLEDSKGKVWMGSGPTTGEGVVLFDGESLTGSRPNGDEWIRYIVEDRNGKIWFSGRQNGVFFFDGKSFKKFTEKLDIGSAILADKAGNIWFDGGEKLTTIESGNGIWRYNGIRFENFNRKNGMGKYAVWSILEDSKGNIWIGTRNMGLLRYDGKAFADFSE
ncbi:MAG: two-component regulator propeller domain-containing protein [Chitinophagaceae bacterium]|jgi:ligand-binding sensor domain-containing protein